MTNYIFVCVFTEGAEEQNDGDARTDSVGQLGTE